jgi:hypothetical protein
MMTDVAGATSGVFETFTEHISHFLVAVASKIAQDPHLSRAGYQLVDELAIELK